MSTSFNYFFVAKKFGGKELGVSWSSQGLPLWGSPDPEDKMTEVGARLESQQGHWLS
jgi:hypothetical protein